MKPMVLYTLQNNVFTGSEGRWGKHLSDLKGDLRGHEIFMLMAEEGFLASSKHRTSKKGGRQHVNGMLW